MAYRLPVFNLTVQIRHYVSPGVYTAWVDSPAQLTGVTKLRTVAPGLPVSSADSVFLLKLPAGTDVRESLNFSTTGQVQVPGYGGAPFYVGLTYDVAVGFPNEYRVAVLVKNWTSPTNRTQLPGQGPVPSS